MEIAAFQALMEELYGEDDRARGLPTTVARHNLTASTEVGIDFRYLDTLTTDAVPVFAAYADRSPAVAALACRPDPDRSLWSVNWSRWDAARLRDQLGCAPGS